MLKIFKRVSFRRNFSAIPKLPLDIFGNGSLPTRGKEHRECEAMIKTLFSDTDISEGFGDVYNSYLDAICEYDLDFFKEVCEPTLASRITVNLKK